MASFRQPTSFNTSFLYENGCELSVASAGTSLTINPGILRTSDNSNDIIIDEAITILTTSVGFNGLDTGSLAANTLYDIYGLMDPTYANPTGAIMCVSGDTPYLPSGYGLTRYIGYARTNGTPVFMNYTQSGNRSMRHYNFTPVLMYGGAGTGGSTYANLDLSSYVPDNVMSVDLIVSYGANSASNVFNLRQGGVTYGAKIMQNDTATNQRTENFTVDCSASKIVSYLTTSASDTLVIYLTGFTDYI